jgi:DNA-directed RNA polymerase subunit RPC12/RpoP
MFAFNCPRCKRSLSREEREAGRKIACPFCSQRVQVPQPPTIVTPDSRNSSL